MKSPGLSTCVWLLAIGATATLLIGAFARFDPSAAAKTGPAASSVALANSGAAPESAGAPTLPADLSPGLAEIIRLAQAHVDEGVILAFIQNSGQVYTPTAEEILYLADLGLPQNVISALFKDNPPATPPGSSAIAAAPPTIPEPGASPSPAPTPDSSFFYNDLAPYGAWVQAPDYGLAWQPTVATIDADWCPYLDHGQWLDSESGWYWQSDYTWGWAAFHYGRWIREPRLGWVWVPDNLWAPAWVAWRSTGSYYGWAPLPPGATLNALGQLTFTGSVLGAANIPPSSFVFVDAENFLRRNLRRRAVPVPRAANLFAQSAIVGNYSIANNKVINGGINREAVAAATGNATKPVALRSVSSPTVLAAVADRATLAVYRPQPSAAAPEAWSQSSPFLLNKPPVQPAASPSAPQAQSASVAEPYPEESSFLPAPPGSVGPDLQLPPLWYAGSPSSHVKPLASAVVADTTSPPRPLRHQRHLRLDPVERPATPAPPIEGGAPAAEPRRVVEAPRVSQPEPARAETSPAGASSKPSGNSASSSHR
jgi:hypothetical protein